MFDTNDLFFSLAAEQAGCREILKVPGEPAPADWRPSWRWVWSCFSSCSRILAAVRRLIVADITSTSCTLRRRHRRRRRHRCRRAKNSMSGVPGSARSYRERPLSPATIRWLYVPGRAWPAARLWPPPPARRSTPGSAFLTPKNLSVSFAREKKEKIELNKKKYIFIFYYHVNILWGKVRKSSSFTFFLRRRLI